MASYTMQLREYIESWAQYDSGLSTREIIEKGRQKLFDFDYPIFDPNYKAVFETHFIRNFYMREIGFETEGLFKFQLETWLLINMPYFNKLFESELIKYDPLVNSEMNSTWTRNKNTDGNVDSTTKGDKTGTNNQSINGTQTTENFNRELEMDTPESRLSITTEDGKGVIEYASNITEGTTKNNSSNTNSVNGNTTDSSTVSGNTATDITETESFIQNRVGKSGSASYSKMLNEYRDSLYRVEKKMFEEMQQLFMLVY